MRRGRIFAEKNDTSSVFLSPEGPDVFLDDVIDLYLCMAISRTGQLKNPRHLPEKRVEALERSIRRRQSATMVHCPTSLSTITEAYLFLRSYFVSATSTPSRKADRSPPSHRSNTGSPNNRRRNNNRAPVSRTHLPSSRLRGSLSPRSPAMEG